MRTAGLLWLRKKQSAPRRATLFRERSSWRRCNHCITIPPRQTCTRWCARATVYRNLGVLANRGEVLRVEVPNGADRYDFLNKPHYHAKCRICGGVFDIDMPYQDDIVSQVSDAHGFTIEHHEIIFDGVCAHCKASAEN